MVVLEGGLGEWCTVTVTVMISTTAPISKKQKVGMKYLAKILWESSLNTPCAVLLGFFALCYLSLSREVTRKQRKDGRRGRI